MGFVVSMWSCLNRMVETKGLRSIVLLKSIVVRLNVFVLGNGCTITRSKKPSEMLALGAIMALLPNWEAFAKVIIRASTSMS